MKRFTSKGLRSSLVLTATLLMTGGCLSENPIGPEPSDPATAPTLPAVENLTFDFGFFQEPDPAARASKQNFWNAYVRAVAVNAITHVVLTPPVFAFSLALHSVPSPQSDGSWIWVYTYVNGDEEAQIRLRGHLIGDDHVAWELRVTNSFDVPAVDNQVWFEGETWDDGDSGFFRFHDFHGEGNPIVARMDWGQDPDGNFLRFTDLNENVDDTLEFREMGSRSSFTFADASDPELGWYIRWDESDGTGSLRAPDYNDGDPACWDEHQNDVECPPVS